MATVGWSGIENGELLRLAAERFDVLITADRNVEHQQNLITLPVSVVVLVASTNRIESLAPLVPELLEPLKALPLRQLVRHRRLTFRLSGGRMRPGEWRIAILPAAGAGFSLPLRCKWCPEHPQDEHPRSRVLGRLGVGHRRDR